MAGKPDYYKFPRELYEAARELPGAQGARLCLAALALFYDGEEPEGLSVRATGVMSGFRGRISKARANYEAASAKRIPNERQTDSKRIPSGRETDSERGTGNSALAGITFPTPAQVVSADKRKEKREKRYRDYPPPPTRKERAAIGGDWISDYFGKTWRT